MERSSDHDELNAVVFLVGTAVGCVVALMRISSTRPVQLLARTYTDIFRSLPLLVLLVWLFFAFPLLPLAGDIRFSPFTAAVLGLSVNLSAFVAEIVRGGIEAVPEHHIDAAKASGFSQWQTWRYITAPMALRIMVAPLFGQYINQTKLSVLASVIAVPELLHTVNTITTETFRPLELYTTLAALFLFILLPCTWLQGRLEHRRSSATPAEVYTRSPDHDSENQNAKMILPSSVRWDVLPKGSALVVRDLSFTYNGTPALDSVCLEAAAGSITSIIGANGSGKTTLLKCFCHLHRPASGTVSLNSDSATFVEDGHTVRVGYLAQQHEPWPHLSVLQNLLLPLRVVGGLKPDAAHSVATDWLRAVHLESRTGDKPSQLSGGEKQRLVFARTLCLCPQVLLLDEPTSAMDFRWALAVHRALRHLADCGVLIVAISHGLSFLRDVANKAVFLDGGRVLEAGDAEAILRGPQTDELRRFLEAA